MASVNPLNVLPKEGIVLEDEIQPAQSALEINPERQTPKEPHEIVAERQPSSESLITNSAEYLSNLFERGVIAEETLSQEMANIQSQTTNALSEVLPTPLASMFASSNPQRRTETILCKICITNMSPSECFCLKACSHWFCVSCLESFAENAVSEGQFVVKCPSWDGDTRCSSLITNEDMQALLKAATFQKLEKFKALRIDSNRRACPKCENVQVGDEKSPAMLCEECGHTFCFIHDDRHPAMTCDDYDKANSEKLRLEREEEMRLRKECKLCPNPDCKAPTMKSDGCNHLICARCQTHWCWLCGQSFPAGGEFPQHFSDPFGCPGGQFLPDGQRISIGWRVFVVLPWALTGPLVAVLFAVSTFFLLPCLASRPPFRRRWFSRNAILQMEDVIRAVIVGALAFAISAAFIALWASVAIALLGLLLILVAPCFALAQRNGSTSTIICQLAVLIACFPCWLCYGDTPRNRRARDDDDQVEAPLIARTEQIAPPSNLQAPGVPTPGGAAPATLTPDEIDAAMAVLEHVLSEIPRMNRNSGGESDARGNTVDPSDITTLPEPAVLTLPSSSHSSDTGFSMREMSNLSSGNGDACEDSS